MSTSSHVTRAGQAALKRNKRLCEEKNRDEKNEKEMTESVSGNDVSVWDEEWQSLNNEIVKCNFKMSVDTLCMIMHCFTQEVEIDTLPRHWTQTKLACDENKTANTLTLACNHTFHPTCIALHFLKTDMRCPVCRVGPNARMKLDCIPQNIRSCFEKCTNDDTYEDQTMYDIFEILSAIELQVSFKFECHNTYRQNILHTRLLLYENLTEMTQVENHVASHPRLHSSNDLNLRARGLHGLNSSQIEQLYNRGGPRLRSNSRLTNNISHTGQNYVTSTNNSFLPTSMHDAITNAVFGDSVISESTLNTPGVSVGVSAQEQLQQPLLQQPLLQQTVNSTDLNNHFQHGLRFSVHRSFNRVFSSFLQRQSSSEIAHTAMQLTHPLIPLEIKSETFNASDLHNFFYSSSGIHKIPMFCAVLAGSEPLAVFILEYDSDSTVQNIYVDVNYQAIVNVASYVQDVLQNIEVVINDAIVPHDS